MSAADQAVLTQPRLKPPKTAPQWPMSLALLFALASAMGGLGAAFTEASWWFVAVGVAALVTVALAIVRAYTRFAFLIPITGAVVALICLTFSFAPTIAIIGFIPDVGVFTAFGELAQDGFDSIADQTIPADPVPGIVFLVTIGSAILAILLDAIAFVAKRPAIVGILLLAVILVPTFFSSGQYDPFFFFLTSIAYLLVLYLGLGETRTGGAIGVGAGGLAVALILPLLLPPVQVIEPEDNRPGFAVGVNAFITLGESLRRDGESRVLTYTTTSSAGVYLTVSVIDTFDGKRWAPALPITRTGAGVDAIGPIPGFDADGVDQTEFTTAISIVNMGGHWLPAPYAPRSISGADETWTFNAESLEIDSPTESARGEDYVVTSARPDPTVTQLRAVETTVAADPRFLALPNNVPEVVATTAAEVTANATNPFDKAMALQSYFLGGGFEYSETAPVEDGYDGAGVEVVAEFLAKKSGYCVHFSSAMAIMARSVGIPSRIAVGFTPGTFTRSNDEAIPDFFAVTTKNFHAWPELWFDGIGWVRFEPTVGLGEAPTFGQSDDPTGPDDFPTLTPTNGATSTPTPTATPSPTRTPGVGEDSGPASINATVPRVTVAILVGVAIIVLLLPLLPALVRTSRRLRREWSVRRRGAAAQAWKELRDTAVDLGWDVATTTPRQFADIVNRGSAKDVAAALARLLAAIEVTAYSPHRGASALADLRLVRRAMWKSATRSERVRAVLSPASVVLRRRSASPR